MKTPITINGVVIRQDAEGRYSLDDLHRAAGGDPDKSPEKFLALESTKQLIQDIEAGTDKPAVVKYPHVLSPSPKR